MWWSSSTYDERLTNWVSLREELSCQDLETALATVNQWWFEAPFVNRHLHPQDVDNWPTPWELLADNLYCTLTRALGMMYTLMLTNNAEIEELAIICYDNEYLLSINNNTYLLNYSTTEITPPENEDFDSAYTVVNSTSKELKNKIGL